MILNHTEITQQRLKKEKENYCTAWYCACIKQLLIFDATEYALFEALVLSSMIHHGFRAPIASKTLSLQYQRGRDEVSVCECVKMLTSSFPSRLGCSEEYKLIFIQTES